MFAVAAASAHAAPVAYGEAFDTLYRIDLDARTATAVGAAGRYAGQDIVNISGLVQAREAFYAIAGGFKLLLRVDPGSGAATVIGSLGLSGQGSGQFDPLDLNMTAACDGTLWLSSAVANKLWTVDRGTGATTLVGPTGRTITGLAAHGKRLYGAGGKGDNSLYDIDPATGAATLIGPFGAAAPAWITTVSMSFDERGALWAVFNYTPPAPGSSSTPDWSDLAKIDPVTGKVTMLGPITGPGALRGVGMKGFTVGPAPCGTLPAAQPAPVGAPWALALLGALLAIAGRRHFRRAF
ncbi:MAG: hypothetical protein GXC76_03425 [Rhodanobacteraceae bacterium]|jgi:hypothetical protein|nr:hypothetical protein [Rhodanobacteraceae bacterium]